MEKGYIVKIGEIQKEYPKGTTYEEIAKEYQKDYQHPIALVIRNGKIRELFKKVDKDCELEFVTLADDIGHKTYVRTATLILMKAITEVVGQDNIKTIKMEFAIGEGYYYSKQGDFEVTKELVDKVKAKMQEYVDKDLRIMKSSMSLEDANELFEKQKMYDKIKLFRYRGRSTVNGWLL